MNFLFDAVSVGTMFPIGTASYVDEALSHAPKSAAAITTIGGKCRVPPSSCFVRHLQGSHVWGGSTQCYLPES